MASSLESKVVAFARELSETFTGTLPGTPGFDAEATVHGDRYFVRPTTEDGSTALIPLHVDGSLLATMSAQIYLEADSSGAYLKNVRSEFAAYSVLDRQPLFRLDYRTDMHSVPSAHWQFHAERGSLTHLLTLAQAHRPKSVRDPHLLSGLHFPVGGERFRPCLEDLIHFFIQECGVDSVPGWRKVVDSGRERWRRRQLRSAVRDLQAEAADVLTQEGWQVIPPAGLLDERAESLREW
ncbi:MAG: hypothetical protein RIA38_04565 [Microcella pacifica]|uniref:Uncharacterized protein n=1 Tax=Microcella pacifica TaxID=2591847 RepID=A0A9E5JTY2_9MICO|nr:hypothetical protein [Microcella pacifica]NHF62398.1 hypothetical protein [Microcella pacifica]